VGYRATADIVVAFAVVVLVVYFIYGICLHKEMDPYAASSKHDTTLELPTDYPGAAVLYTSTKSYTLSMARSNLAKRGRYNTRM
jgi:hypothetical protein